MNRQFGIVVAAVTVALTAFPAASSQNPPNASASSPTAQKQQQAAAPVAPIPQDQAAATKAKADADAEADRQEARLTQKVTKWSAIAQAASAVLVTVFTGVLVYYSHRGWQVAKRAADAATDAAKAADRSVTKMEEIAAGQTTDMQASIGEQTKSAKAMQNIAVSLAANVRQLTDVLEINRRIAESNAKMAEVALSNLQAEQRARLDVVMVEFPKFGPGMKPLVSFQLMNSGRSTAKITDFYVFILTETPLPQQRDVDPWISYAATVPPGRSATLRMKESSAEPFTTEEWQRVQTGEFSLAVYGAVRYEAGFDIIGEVGFGVVFDPAIDGFPFNRRFASCGIPGYSYST